MRESDGGDEDALPDRPVSPHPNRVRPRGLRLLEAREARLQAERDALRAAGDALDAGDRRRAVDRDLRYVRARLAQAVVVAPPPPGTDTVAFGTRVTVADGDGVARTFAIVGEDEADADAGLVSWSSPLARAVEGARVDDEVTWKRPAGDVVLTVLRIEVPPDA